MAKITLFVLLIAAIAATSVQEELGWVELPKPLDPEFIALVKEAAMKGGETVGEIQDGYYEERVDAIGFKAVGTLSEEGGFCDIYFAVEFGEDTPTDISYDCGHIGEE